MTTRDRLTLVGAEVSVLSLTVLGWVLSYWALVRLSEHHGYAGWEARLWPLSVDMLALAAALIAMSTAKRGHGPTGEAWLMAAAAAVVTVAGNILSAGGDPIAMAQHAWPAVMMLGAWHLFFRSVESDRSSVRAPVTQPVKAALTTDPLTGHRSRPVAKRRSSVTSTHDRSKVAAIVAELQASGERVTGQAIAARLKVSPSTGQRFLREHVKGVAS